MTPQDLLVCSSPRFGSQASTTPSFFTRLLGTQLRSSCLQSSTLLSHPFSPKNIIYMHARTHARARRLSLSFSLLILWTDLRAFTHTKQALSYTIRPSLDIIFESKSYSSTLGQPRTCCVNQTITELSAET